MICVRRLGALAVFVFLLAVAAACGRGEAPCTSEETSCEPRDVSAALLCAGAV